jgi:hypothetical protein
MHKTSITKDHEQLVLTTDFFYGWLSMHIIFMYAELDPKRA